MINNFALIIGAMKCGTTSLFAYLAQHPRVAPSALKETHFFSKDDKWSKGFKWYRSLWDVNPHKHTILLEASPSYTAMPRSPNAAERIATIDADFRFIYLLRDPFERIESHYAHGVRQGTAPTLGKDEILPEWISFSKYAMQITAYYKLFPRDRVLLLDFADLKSQPEQLVKRVCRFLDIDDTYAFRGLGTAHNVSRKDHPLYTALAQNRLACAVAKLVPRRYKQSLRNKLAGELDKRLKLSDKQREIIRRRLADDQKQLREEYGFDTSHWL